MNKKSLFLRRNFSIHFRPCHAIDFARDKEDEILNRLLRMILRINPVRYWNFVSQTDANEQEKIDFTSEFLNSFILVTQSVSRVTKKMKFFKSLLRMILRINPVRNWNFISQTDANEQEKPVFTS